MAVSDLTNTTWVFKSAYEMYTSGNMTTTGTFAINFTSANNNYTNIGLSKSGDYYKVAYYSYIEVLSFDTDDKVGDWISNDYKTITITGGTDATNALLIDWLVNNATQQATPTGKTQLGTRAITKKMFGTREITKEVVNGVVVYEKQAPSGFSVTFNFTEENGDHTGTCNLKVGTAPSNINDYDYYFNGGFEDGSKSICDKNNQCVSGQSANTYIINVPNNSTLYFWLGQYSNGKIYINNVEKTSTTYSSPYTINITQDTTIDIKAEHAW